MSDNGNPYDDFLAGRITAYERDQRLKTWKPSGELRSGFWRTGNGQYWEEIFGDGEKPSSSSRPSGSWDAMNSTEKFLNARRTPDPAAERATRSAASPGYHQVDKASERAFEQARYPNSPPSAATR